MQLDRIQSFIKVAEFSSFTRAADIFNIPKSKLSRQVKELEAELGVLLFQRSNRNVSLTQEGQLFYEECRNAIIKLEEARSLVREHSAEPKGRLRVTTPPELGQYIAEVFVPVFLKRFPQIRLEIESSTEIKDLVKESFDLALRPGKIENENLIVRKIGQAEFILAGNKNFYSKVQRMSDLSDIEKLPFILRRPSTSKKSYIFSNSSKKIELVPHEIIFETTNFFSAKHAMLNNLGISFMPRFLIDRELQAGTLYNLMEGFDSDSTYINVVIPTRKYMPLKVRVFIDTLVELTKKKVLCF